MDATFAKDRAAQGAADTARRKLNMALGAALPRAKAAYLARAAEFAMRSVLVTWGRPTTSSKKLWRAVAELTPVMSEELAGWLIRVEAERESQVNDLLTSAEEKIECILAMADRPDPQASEVRVAVGWDGLAETERNFLREAAAAVQAVIPGAELWLFGSRSWGGAEPTSDYDVLLVMPDGTPTEMRSSAMGGIWLAAQRRGKTVDHKHVGRSLFDDPSQSDQDVLLYYEVHATGFCIPFQAEPGGLGE